MIVAWRVGSPEEPVEDEVLGTALMAVLADDHTAVLRRVLVWAGEYVSGRDPATHGELSQRNLRLTEAEFVEMIRRVNLAIGEITEAHDPQDPVSRFWSLEIIAADDTI